MPEKETLAQVFSCEFFEISRNTFFYRKPLVASSGDRGSLIALGDLIRKFKKF